MKPQVLDVAIGDRVVLKKGHPCGANLWEVVRIGADIGVKCSGCGRRVLLERAALGRRLKEIRRASGAEGTDRG